MRSATLRCSSGPQAATRVSSSSIFQGAVVETEGSAAYRDCNAPGRTTRHAGYARYFTPPPQAIAAPTNIAPFANTTAQPETFQQSPVLPERSHYFDAGIVQRITPNLQVGIDAYYKIARDCWMTDSARRSPEWFQLRNGQKHRCRAERYL